ncbi:MAG TPA: hypothetical protein VM681_09920 [Candidatus Thermoplasmatota archaeon]|nr:hypothetical protein [Candidatus Thermoplasmatota archaeon]
MRTRWIVLALAILAAHAVAQGNPSPDEFYLSRIQPSHDDPTGMLVVIVPPAAVQASIHEGPDLESVERAVEAIREAIDYWDWSLRRAETAHPQLTRVTWTTKVLGIDAAADDLSRARIVVTTAFAGDPLPFAAMVGYGFPLPWGELVEADGATHCAVMLLQAGAKTGDRLDVRLRNLALHEFGHCLAAGHTGDEKIGTSASRVCSYRTGLCYATPNAGRADVDLLSFVRGTARMCLSNLNVQSVADAYTHLPGPWRAHGYETYMRKSDYEQACMPSLLERF